MQQRRIILAVSLQSAVGDAQHMNRRHRLNGVQQLGSLYIFNVSDHLKRCLEGNDQRPAFRVCGEYFQLAFYQNIQCL
ncbi:hypothetical protein D3C75_1315690 [compost metagenome]